MSPSKILFYFCIFFIAGVAAQSLIKIPQIFLWAFLFLGMALVFASLFFKKANFVFGFFVLFLLLGICRTQITQFNIENNKLAKLNDGLEKITLLGFVADESGRGKGQKLKINIEGSTVLVSANKYPEYIYLDKVKITGKLKTPNSDFSAQGGSASGGNYKNYLLKDGIYSVMDFPKIEVIGKQKPDFWQKIYSAILWVKLKLRQSVQKLFLPPHSSVLEGMLLGDNNALPDELKTKLNTTGLRHIIAVSGTHIVIVSKIIMILLLALGLGRKRAFWFAVILIVLYIFLTGLPPSGIRAGIMGVTVLLGKYLGRQASGQRLIAIACGIMLLANPLFLIYDVGFQLSFLAALGLIYLEPVLKWAKIPGIFATTLAAQIFTLPIMLFDFGNISLIAPITNLLVLISADAIMIFGFLSAIGGAVFYWLGWIFSVPCWILLEYFLKVIDIFSAPWCIKTFENVHWIWIVILYIPIISATAYFRKKTAMRI